MTSLTDNLMLSIKISAMATLVVLLVGTPLARALSSPGTRGQRLLDVIINLPLAIPPTVIGYFLLIILGREGIVGKLFVHVIGSSLIFTQAAAVIASSIVALPLFVQGARSSLEVIPPEVYEAAQMDGANRRQTFLNISLPLSWHGFCSGLLLAFVRSLGEFGATIMVAGNIPGRTQTMALAIYTAIQSGQDDTARTLALILTLLAALSMAVGLRWRHIYREEQRPSRR